MNIGLVTVWADCGAGYVSKAYEAVLAQKHKVYIYARGSHASGRDDPFWDMPNVTWDPTVGGVTRIYQRAYERWLDQNQIDLVLFNEQRYWQSVVNTRKKGILTVAYVDYYTAQTVELFNLYDALICNTYRHYSVFAHHPQAWYIPWGTDCRLYQPSERWATMHATVIFFHSSGIGGANDRKGTGTILEAFQKVTGNAELIIHSQLPLAQLPTNWQGWIKNDERIQFIEGTVKPPGLYHLGDVYVYPTRLEGIGLTILEAQACGLPVIVTNNAPMNEFVTHGETGTLVQIEEQIARYDGYYWPETPCQIESLTSAMQAYVDDRAMLLRQQENARQHALSYRSWNDNAQKLFLLLEAINRLHLEVKEENRLIQLSRMVDERDEPTAATLLKRGLIQSAVQLRNLRNFL